MEAAYAARARVLAENTGYRLINGEGDHLPGLIVDVYNKTAVIQIGTLGMERLKPLIVENLQRLVNLEGIYERSESSSRVQEGLPTATGVLHGIVPPRIQISEYGMKIFVDVVQGQKTGFFLDQREMRALVRQIAPGMQSVLNCFSYTGGFSIAAGLAGVSHVVSVDCSADALAIAAENAAANGLAVDSQQCVTADVFDFLKSNREQFDLVIVDPPAFAKKKSHVQNAARAYGELNRLALERVSAGGYLLSCSCSHYLEEGLLGQILFQSARDIGRQASIVQRQRLALDHPVSIYHPEGAYLKSFLLAVN